MKELPFGWCEANLFDICTPKQWPTIATKKLSPTGYPAYGANGVIGFHSEYNHEDPTILITCRGATCGTINVSQPKSWVNGNAMCLDDLQTDGVDFRYALHALKNRGFDDTITGTAQPQITRAGLAPVTLRIAPLNEQRRIVAKLDACMTHTKKAKEALDAIPPLLEKFRQSVLAAAFRGDLTKDWREKNPDVEPASELLKRIRVERRQKWEEADAIRIDTARTLGHTVRRGKYSELVPRNRSLLTLADLPSTWCWTSLDELTYFTVDYRGRTPKKSKSGIPLISSAAIRHDLVRVGPSGYVTPETYDEALTRGVAAPGDVVITTEAPVGEVALYPRRKSLLSRRVLACKVSGANPRFVMHAMYSEFARAHAKEFRRGATVPRILKPDLLATPLPLPTREEQDIIVEKIDAAFAAADVCDRLRAQGSKEIHSLDASLLAKAFRGELVPQDPNDEPASVLLERIRAERAVAEAKAPKKKRKARKKKA